MPERRRRRSDDTVTALHYQLSTSRTEGHLDAVVLVDGTGCLVAGAGAWPVCEELAAYAPLLANPSDVGNAVVGSRIARLKPHVDVMRVSIDGAEALLCGCGGLDRRRSMTRAAEGCRRILNWSS